MSCEEGLLKMILLLRDGEYDYSLPRTKRCRVKIILPENGANHLFLKYYFIAGEEGKTNIVQK